MKKCLECEKPLTGRPRTFCCVGHKNRYWVKQFRTKKLPMAGDSPEVKELLYDFIELLKRHPEGLRKLLGL